MTTAHVPTDLVDELLASLKVMVEAHGYVSYCSDDEKYADPDVIAACAVIEKARNIELVARCCNCAEWGREDDVYDIPSAPKGIRRCLHPRVGGGERESDEHERTDAANSYECIGTGPEFCCIHWTPNAKVREPEAALSPEAPSRLEGSAAGQLEV